MRGPGAGAADARKVLLEQVPCAAYCTMYRYQYHLSIDPYSRRGRQCGSGRLDAADVYSFSFVPGSRFIRDDDVGNLFVITDLCSRRPPRDHRMGERRGCESSEFSVPSTPGLFVPVSLVAGCENKIVSLDHGTDLNGPVNDGSACVLTPRGGSRCPRPSPRRR